MSVLFKSPSLLWWPQEMHMWGHLGAVMTWGSSGWRHPKPWVQGGGCSLTSQWLPPAGLGVLLWDGAGLGQNSSAMLI